MTTFRTTCWSCGSSNNKETLSREKCNDCGIEVDYHGGGLNNRAQEALANKHWLEEQKEHEEWLKWRYSDEWQQ